MKRTHNILCILITAVTLFLAACGNPSPSVDFATLESARMQANDNSTYNAASFRATHPEYAEYSVSARGDSAQKDNCPQGDGWASIDLTLVAGNTKSVTALKCSTVSEAIGCMADVDFKQRSYASQDGKCDTSLPFPLPKIKK
ncbi:hypothetical protein [Methylovulum miyakonense]|uniref:hypothetical protein n=1 Tax=Methylovulum miyakonense TaxID=645578 RepID=UPI000365D03A|nr:hypothetical protein [Methylovulum miyakonense]